MDHLREIIHTLNDEDIKEFKHFLNRMRKKNSRKDLDLFLLLIQNLEYSREELLRKLYPEDANLQAYHATRKRLIKQIQEFIYIKRIHEDSTLESQLTGMLSFCKHLFEQNLKDTAWTYLKKTIELAKKGQHFQLLVQAYLLGIENSLDEKAIPIEELIKLKEKAQNMAIKEEDATLANYLIRNKLKRALQNGEEIDIVQLVIDTFKETSLDPSLFDDPKLVFEVTSMARSAALNNKDFHSFEPYVIAQYNKLESTNKFDKYTHQYKVRMLYMITHVLYRNKKFKEALSYSETWMDNLLAYNKSEYKRYYQKYNLLIANILTYSGEINKANDILETSIKNKLAQSNPIEYNNTLFNLTINYFYNEKYGRAIRTFNRLQHSDSYYTKIMGREWVLKKLLVEILIQYELENSDIVESRIRLVDKNFFDFLKRPTYKQVETFLNFVKKLNNNPFVAQSKDFIDQLENAFIFQSYAIEDIQYMTFYAWLKSKAIKESPYKTTVSMLNRN